MIKIDLTRLFRDLTLVAAAVLLSGCLTSTEVRSIVDESNQEILKTNERILELNRQATIAAIAGEAGVPADPDDPQSPGDDNYATAAERIQAFIEQNPNLPEVINPLRVRLAVLQMVNGRPNLAAASFEEVSPDSSLSERDLMLYNLRDGLVWWYDLNRPPRAFELTDKRHADMFIDEIEQQIKEGAVRSQTLLAWVTDLSRAVADRRLANFTPGESTAGVSETKARMSAAMISYTSWWNAEMRQDLKTMYEVMPQSCPKTKAARDAWKDELRANLRSRRQSGNALELGHWKLFRWYALFYCNAESLQFQWLRNANTGELLPVSSWMRCDITDSRTESVDCKPTRQHASRFR